MEKRFAVLLLVALLVTGAYFAGSRRSGAPYRLEPACPAPVASASAGPEPVHPKTTSAGRLDINTATAQELEALPGIGEKRARDIVADREANGPFRHPEDITRVKGIGEATMEGLLDYITVN